MAASRSPTGLQQAAGSKAECRLDDAAKLMQTSRDARGALRRSQALVARVIFALPPKADMCSALAHVGFGPKPDIGARRCLTGPARQNPSDVVQVHRDSAV